jgi:3-oxoacyl-[acyl-carrier protein] reductase
VEDKYQAKVAHHSVDLTVHDDLERLAAACSDIDILINNAGSIPGGTLLEIDEKKWRQAWELKVFGYINLTRLIYESMIRRRSGVVVNIIGLGGERHRPQYIAGCSGNSALMAFTRALGAESVDHGVRIVGINPGRTLTDRQLAHLKEAAEREYGSPERWTDVRDGIAKQLPLGRFISTEDISNLVLFLASERAAYISATVVTLDGGQSLRPRT